MGTGGFGVFTCNEPNFGDDGILRTRGDTMIPGCMATYPPFLGFQPALDRDTAGFAANVTCVAAVGTNGCGFEQQLDATLKAVSLSTATDQDGRPLTFVSGTVGHADGANAGFLRPDSVLAIIMVTDEDDCSAIDPDIFNEGSERYPGMALNLRCFQYPEAVHPIQRYVHGLIQTRRPDLLVFGAIVGVPPDLIGAPADYDAILADPRMIEAPDPDMRSQLTPSCNVPGRGLAFPPRRIVSVARDLERAGARAVVQSVCQESFDGPIDAILREIGDALRGSCLSRPIPRMASGLVDCELFEALPPVGEITRCEQLADRGRTLDRVVDGERGPDYQVCRVAQAPEGGAGWFYDDFSADVLERCGATPQRVSFTPGAESVAGATLTLNCAPPPGVVGLGTDCSDPTICGRVPGLACDPLSVRCHALCETDAECSGALGDGRVCADPDGDGMRFCVDVACLAAE